jgi:Erv1 / Alr family
MLGLGSLFRRRPSKSEVSEVGNATWKMLHSISEYYPERPTEEERKAMRQLMHSLSVLYPCPSCRVFLKAVSVSDSIDATSRSSLRESLCRMHNFVNASLGKELFPCSRGGRGLLDRVMRKPTQGASQLANQ